MDIEIFYQKDADKYAQDCADIFDDNNKGKYVGEPRTLYVQTSVAF